ncbi:hypothetical protein CYMTET_29975 [Cymbomonas tetramitiformis]|uniref:Uncharacterized protein n=1 Tax=Cymbomonas tetramitiformis TaxID=36881 RepID=A0AAE0FK06_9CHLO|nr:hypothetical protein CYMTET_29975 [Cymbomonas tetramitiformis]
MAEDEFNLPDTRRRPPSKPVEYSKDNVVQWALSRVDQSLDEFEEEPNSVAKVIPICTPHQAFSMHILYVCERISAGALQRGGKDP